jgi:hypothetical protein
MGVALIGNDPFAATSMNSVWRTGVVGKMQFLLWRAWLKMICNQKAINFYQQARGRISFWFLTVCARNLIRDHCLLALFYMNVYGVRVYHGEWKKWNEKAEMAALDWKKWCCVWSRAVFFFLNLLSQLFYQNNNKWQSDGRTRERERQSLIWLRRRTENCACKLD